MTKSAPPASCCWQSQPWDDSAPMFCQKPKGHDGYHAYTAEWDDSGNFVDDEYAE